MAERRGSGFETTDDGTVVNHTHSIAPETMAALVDALKQTLQEVTTPFAGSNTSAEHSNRSSTISEDSPATHSTPQLPMYVRVRMDSRFILPIVFFMTAVVGSILGYRAADSVSPFDTPSIPATAEASPILSKVALHPRDYSEEQALTNTQQEKASLLPAGCFGAVCVILVGPDRLLYYSPGQDAVGTQKVATGLGGCSAIKRAALEELSGIPDSLPESSDLSSIKLGNANSADLKSPEGAELC